MVRLRAKVKNLLEESDWLVVRWYEELQQYASLALSQRKKREECG